MKGIYTAVGKAGGAEQQQSDWAQTDTTKPDFIKNKPTFQTFVNLGEYDYSTKLFENTVDLSAIPLGTLITFEYFGFWQVGVLTINNTQNKFEIRCLLNAISDSNDVNGSNSDTLLMRCNDTVENYSPNSSTFNVLWFLFRIDGLNHVSRGIATSTKTLYDAMARSFTLRVGFPDYLTDTKQIAFPTAANQYKTIETRKVFKVIDGGTAGTKNIEYCTQTEYDAMTPDPDTLYCIWE